MAAYGTLASLQNLIEHIQVYHAHHLTFLYEHQLQLESLLKKVINLQDLLEWCSNNGLSEAQDLENLIVNTANRAEDLIELYIVHDIRARSFEGGFVNVDVVDPIIFTEQLQKLFEDVDLVEKEMMKIREESKTNHQQFPYPLPSASIEYPRGIHDDGMVGMKDEFNEIMNELKGHEANLKIISITGMGGSGKSTLARSVSGNKSIMNDFDLCGWIIISQEFSSSERLSHLLKEFGVPHNENDEYHVLQEKLHKHLFGRRYLIVVDDIWSVEDWEKLRLFLPDNSNGSRILLTTRLLNLATDIGSSHICKVKFMDEDASWTLLCRKAFLDQTCPSRLEEVGKKISKNCKGLPLSLAVVGGLLARLEKTRVCWEKIAGEINMIVTSEDDECCLKILSLSYRHLPIYLKPCFLYIGIFAEDQSIAMDSLIDLWIAEGFVKSCGASKSLEEVAQNYVEDLIQRNLIYVSKTGNRGFAVELENFFMGGKRTFSSVGRTEHIRIHDLLRDLALNEAHKEKFLHVTRFTDPNFSMNMSNERRVGFHGAYSVFQRSELAGNYIDSWNTIYADVSVSKSRYMICKDKTPEGLLTRYALESIWEFEDALRTSTFLRSLICNENVCISVPTDSFSLLRVSMNLSINYSPEAVFQVINSRNLQISLLESTKLSSIQLLWNLQVLVVGKEDAGIPLWSGEIPHDLNEVVGIGDIRPVTFQIWEMPLLRKLIMRNFILPDPSLGEMGRKGGLVTNLQVISYILDLNCTEEVLRKIYNIQILHLMYADGHKNGLSHYCLDNLDHLLKLQKAGFWFMGNLNWPDRTDLLPNIGLSNSLKNLSLGQCGFEWEFLTEKVGSLPHLEELSLYDCYTGEEWNSEEGFFLCLRILRLRTCSNMVRWSAESSHFPCLEHLFLEKIVSLEEIPLEIGDILTLQSIVLKRCSGSIVVSAKNILQEQQRCGNHWLQVSVDGKRLQKVEEVEVEEAEVEEVEEVEELEGEEDHEEEQLKNKKTKGRGFVAFLISFMAIIGSGYAWRRKGKQKKNNDRRWRRNTDDDSWWLFYDYQ